MRWGRGRNGVGLSAALAMGLPEFTCVIPLLEWKGSRCVQEVETLPAKAWMETSVIPTHLGAVERPTDRREGDLEGTGK